MTAAGKLAELIGTRRQWRDSTGQLYFDVIVEDVREAYGRIDVLVVPANGNGHKWVALESTTPGGDDATP